MNSLLNLSQQYTRKADRIVTRHTNEEGVFDARLQPTIDYYRNASAAVARLAEGSEETSGVDWKLGGDRFGAIAFSDKKVTTRDKAANPLELIKKANG